MMVPVSRYVETPIREMTREEIEQACASLGLTPMTASRPGGTLMLEGCLESAGRPVHLRWAPGTLDAAEDFGILVAGDRLSLICGDVDRARLHTRLLTPLRAEVVRLRAEAHGVQTEVSEGAVTISMPDD